ncbi:MAG: polysaccharide biosynthesis tyrosine autokinase [Aquificae bacterium]|nr:polysaccharide biosynthesis tyrosine autokinase [Aquificota bacterium]
MEQKYTSYKETSIKDFLRPILNHKIGFLTILAVSTAIALFYIFTSSYIYRTDATIEIKETKQTPTRDLLLSVLSGGSIVNLDTEMDLLKSRYMVGRALNHIPYKVSYYKKEGLKYIELYKNSPFKVRVLAVKKNSIFGKRIKLIVKDDRTFVLLYGENFLSKLGITDNFEYKNLHKFGENIDLGDVIIKIEKKGKIEKGEYSFQINDKLSFISRILPNLHVFKTSKDSYLVKVAYQDTVPLRAQEFVNALTTEYIKQTIKNKTSSAEQQLKFINKQLEIINKNLKDAEVKLENFKKEKRLMDLETEINTTIQKLSQFDTKLAELEIKERLINELYNTVIENGIENISPQAYGINDPVLISLVDRLNKALERKKELLAEYTEMHPDVQKINEKIKSIRSSIKSAIFSLRAEIQNQKQAVINIIKRYDELLRKLPENEREFVNLKRRYIVNEKIYSYLLEKKVETSMAKAAVVANNRIIDKAILPRTPIKPKKPIILAIGLLVGLMLGTFYGYVREFLNDTVKTKEDIEKLSTLPIVGLVPKVSRRKLKKKILSIKEPNSIFTEAIRKIRANLQVLFPKGEKGEKIVITSNIDNEGKTTLAVNLAPILSSPDKKVILLDLDIRKPKVHEYFKLQKPEGILDVLIGRKSIDQVIKKTHIKNLDIIPVGKVNSNSSDFFISQKLKEVLNTLEERYDYIVIDAPPIDLVADTILLMKDSDVSLVVLKAGYSKKAFIQNIDKLANEYKIKNIAYVLNYIKPKDIYYGYKY